MIYYYTSRTYGRYTVPGSSIIMAGVVVPSSSSSSTLRYSIYSTVIYPLSSTSISTHPTIPHSPPPKDHPPTTHTTTTTIHLSTTYPHIHPASSGGRADVQYVLYRVYIPMYVRKEPGAKERGHRTQDATGLDWLDW